MRAVLSAVGGIVRRCGLWAAAFLLAAVLAVSGCGGVPGDLPRDWSGSGAGAGGAGSGGGAAAQTAEPYQVLNDNVPYFTEEELAGGWESFETYSPLDLLGRCGPAFASVGQDLMPTEERGNISQVKPSGWQTARYDTVDGEYLYNRCHLIGFQLTGENANERNLITGTRYMNVEGMLPFENMTADYIKETGNHVLYRVTPEFEGVELVARGVRMEAQSVEDGGEGIQFCVFVPNIQPGIEIDYATGDSRPAGEAEGAEGEIADYVLNTNTRKFHRPDCGSVEEMKAENREDFRGTREELLAKGYEPCSRCRP